MGFLTWLFGQKQTSETSTPGPNSRQPSPSEAENLRRWQESGQARSWVQARKGQWNHADWLALLSDLKTSPYWPMQPDAVGQVLEQVKRDLARRN